ncbi:MAG: rhomboid family intramembrane serine protease [Eudoraea sp.]|nr:rhomboid family intramembrane serine protease [Eudoraea sp.]
MTEDRYFKFTNSVLLVPMMAVLLIWVVFWIEVRFRINLNDLGVYPRTLKGLRGVLFSPFIHGSLSHLYNNTIPIAVLSAALMYFYRDVAFRVLVFGFFIGGLLTWIIGRPSYHIGASGMIYVLASFIFFKGAFTRHFRLMALSLIVVFVYGSMLWYIFPVNEGISWEGHLAGFITGLILAFFVKTDIPKPRKYAWEHEDYNEEEDDFLRHFDEDGNFIENPEGVEDSKPGIQIRYPYRKNDPKPPEE